MNSTGMARKVDDLGRIVLPVEMRRMFGIRAGDELEIGVDGEAILLRKLEDRCVFCNRSEGLQRHHDKQVCGSCAHELASALSTGDTPAPARSPAPGTGETGVAEALRATAAAAPPGVAPDQGGEPTAGARERTGRAYLSTEEPNGDLIDLTFGEAQVGGDRRDR